MTPLTFPSSLKAEHDSLSQMLYNAEQLAGETGKAAKQLAQLLQHNSKEEETYIWPLLKLLPLLAVGKYTRDMDFAIALSEKLKDKLKDLLDEHQRIVTALRVFRQTALEAHHPVIAHFADKLLLHEKMQEEVVYPAAILTGEYLRLRETNKELSTAT